MLPQALIAPAVALVVTLATLAVPIAVVVGVLLWMKRPANLAKERTHHTPGPAERASATGSVKVGWVYHNNCARVVEYADGWLVRASWGLVEHWLPKNCTRVGPTRRVLLRRQRELVCGDLRVIVFGHLCDFVERGRVPEARLAGLTVPFAIAA